MLSRYIYIYIFTAKTIFSLKVTMITVYITISGKDLLFDLRRKPGKRGRDYN